MTSLVRHRSDPGPTKKPIISSFFGSFTVPVFKTLVVCMYTKLINANSKPNCVIYQIWGEDLNRISKVQFDSTKTQISTRLIELHFHRTSNILVRADCQPSHLSFALEFSQRERGRVKNQWKWVFALRENSLLCFDFGF